MDDAEQTNQAKAGDAKPVKRRAYHKKVRTGCITCKIRRVRCDEEKPDCSRCVSTGRKCDGYEASSSTSPRATGGSSTQLVATDPRPVGNLRVILPRKNDAEVRSYQFFLECTAPALAGYFDTEFWCKELPKICLADPAVWHAIVSLGSVHELYGRQRVIRKGDVPTRNMFALQQFNAAIQCLVESDSPRHADRWRATTVSTIFTCTCIIQGLYDQSLVHLKAGCNLIRELQDEEAELHRKGGPVRPGALPLDSLPISMAPIRSILFNYEVMAKALVHGGLPDKESLDVLAESDLFSFWRSYKAPRLTTKPYLTSENLLEANRSAESLMHGLTLFSIHHIEEYGAMFTGVAGKDLLNGLAAKQKPHVQCFRELEKAIRSFKKDSSPKEGNRLRKPFLLLDLLHATNRFLLVAEPDVPDEVDRAKRMAALCETIVDLAEQILDLDESTRAGSDKAAFIPYSSTMSPLFLVAHGGIGKSVRQRALALLRRPRLEGLWDSQMGANLAEAIMSRELEAGQEHRQGMIFEKTLQIPGVEMEEASNLQHRVFSTGFDFTGPREAVVELRTWRERMDNQPGKRTLLRW